MEETMLGLAVLPGQTVSSAGRACRKEFELASFDADAVLESMAKLDMRKNADRAKMHAISSAAASFVIEEYWKYIESRDLPAEMRALRASGTSTTFQARVCEVGGYLLKRLNAVRDEYKDILLDRIKPKTPMSKADQLFMVFIQAAWRRNTKMTRIPFPQVIDLSSLLARMLGAAELVFERDVGRRASRDEVFELLRGPSVLRLFMEMMSNVRGLVMPLMARMEGRTGLDCNLDDPNRRFRPEFFEVYEQDGQRLLRLKPSITKAYREAAAARAKKFKSRPETLGCPAMYTGEFRTMYLWMLALFEERFPDDESITT